MMSTAGWASLLDYSGGPLRDSRHTTDAYTNAHTHCSSFSLTATGEACMCLHRQTATSQARETEDAVAQNWWWPKKKKCFGGEPKSNDTEGWWDSDATMDSASLNTEALQRKQMRGSPGSVSRRRRGMLSERWGGNVRRGQRGKQMFFCCIASNDSL